MANVKITELTAITAPATTDVLPIVDVTADTTKKVSVADLLESAGDGAAGTPAFSFASDKDTGIYLPGANQLAVATNGQGRLFVDASGNVGVGTASPAEKLHIQDPSDATIRLDNTGGTARQGRITTTNQGDVEFRARSENSDGQFIFYGYGGTTDSEKVRITSAGLVGIGTSSPGSTLDVVSTQFEALTVKRSGVGAGVKLSLENGDGNTWGLIHDGGENLLFRYESSDLVAIDNTGRLGIGTTSPGVALDVNGDIRAGTGNSLYFNTTAGFSPRITNSGSQNDLSFFTNNTETARIDSSGRLGVGLVPSSSASITNVSAGLIQTDGNIDIRYVGVNSDPGGARYLNFINTDTTLVVNQPMGGIQWIANDSSNPNRETASIRAFSGSNTGGASSMAFRTGAIERMRISNVGNVGIGTQSASAKLTVSDTSGAGYKNLLDMYASSAGQNPLMRFISRNAADTSTTSVDIFKEYQGGFTISNTDTDASNYTSFNVGASERMRIDSDGRLLVGTSSSFADSSRLQVLTKYNTFEDGISLRHTQFTPTAAFKLNFQRSRDNFGGDSAVISGSRLGQINFKGYDGTDYESIGASIYAEVDGTPGSNDMPGRLVFSTTADGASSPTERMRISSNGQIETTQDGSFQVYRRTGTSATAVFAVYSDVGSTRNLRLRINANGNVENTNNSYGAISDIKLKENIVDANSQWDDLKALQVRNYNFKEGQTHTQIGLVAQEAELVSPGLVRESPDLDEDGNDLGTVTKSVNYSVLYMKAVKALQEAMARIETLEQRLSDAGIA